MMKKQIEDLDIPKVDEFLEMIDAGGGEIYACKLAADMFKLKKEDIVIFSCKTIPSEINIRNREKLEKSLHSKGIRIFKEVHVSGHAAKEDLRDFINMVKPNHIFPAHGDINMMNSLAELALEMGYDKKHIHISSNGNKISF